jgi:hypothetical protein
MGQMLRARTPASVRATLKQLAPSGRAEEAIMVGQRCAYLAE